MYTCRGEQRGLGAVLKIINEKLKICSNIKNTFSNYNLIVITKFVINSVITLFDKSIE